MDRWIQMLSLVVIVPTVCKLGDWFISKQRNRVMKDSLTEPWISLATFSCREAIQKSVTYCNALFDQIYGPMHFSWRCFLPSSVISTLSVLLLLQFFSAFSDLSLYRIMLDVKGITFFVLFINIWADYFSLIETRWILRYAETVRFWQLPFLLIIDFVFTSAIYIAALCLFAYLPVATAGLHVNFLEAFKFFWANLTFPQASPGTAAIVWSTFTTSILFYLYCLLALSVKCLGLTRSPIMTFLQNLQEKDRLLTAVGLFLATLILLVSIVSRLFYKQN